MIEVAEAGRLGLLGLAADVDLARRIVADEHDREARDDRLASQCCRPLGDAAAQMFGDGFAVDDGAGKAGRSAWVMEIELLAAGSSYRSA